MPVDRRRHYWMTPVEVLDWCGARNVPTALHPKPWATVAAKIDGVFFDLQMFCQAGNIRAEWRATRVGDHYEPSDVFEAVPAHLWEGITFFQPSPNYEPTDTVQYYGLWPAGSSVEIRFRRTDVERELRPYTAKRKPSRLKWFWPKVREFAFAWLKKNGCPSEQARLENPIADFIERNGWIASEATIRRYASRWIKEFKDMLLQAD